MNLTRLLAYDHWANQGSFRPLRVAGAPQQAISVFAHIVAISEFWLARVNGEAYGDAWPDWDLEVAGERLDRSMRGWSTALSEVRHADDGFTYTNSTGHICHNSFTDVVLELVS